VKRALPLLVSVAAVAAVIIPYAALGGASYAPTPLADPCETRERSDPDGLSEALEQVALSGLDGAACTLGVSREELVLAIRTENALDDFAGAQGIARASVEEAVREGLLKSLEEAKESGALSGLVAGLAERAVESVPPHLLLEALQRLGALLP
jgi:hypothetical protein